MGTLLGLMHSAPSSELQLKTDILRVTTHEFTSQSELFYLAISSDVSFGKSPEWLSSE